MVHPVDIAATLANYLNIKPPAAAAAEPVPMAPAAETPAPAMICMAAAKAQGVEAIYMTDKIDERLAVARNAGATWAGNPDKAPTPAMPAMNQISTVTNRGRIPLA